MRIGVIGASGFLGAEFVRLLEGHRHAKLTMACGNESAGRDLADVRPNIAESLIIQPPSADELATHCDAVVLALPHGQSAPWAEELIRRDKIVVDLGSDFRLKDSADVMTYYQREAPRQRLLDAAWYGLPEISGPPPAGTRLISAPGCFATALGLMLAPLAETALPRVNVFGVTGSSGSGIQPSSGVHHSTRSSGFTAYKPLSHQHMGEVKQLLKGKGWSPQIDFVPHSAPVVRGIHLTLVLDMPTEELWPLYEKAYGEKMFVRLRTGQINMGSVGYSNSAVIGITGTGSQSVVCVAIDNLIKGGAGQGLQNLNLLMGWPENEGLPLNGAWP